MTNRSSVLFAFSLATALLSSGCAAPPDCASIAQRYRTLCPTDASGAASIVDDCLVLEHATTCVGEARAVQSCFGADFGGYAGALCGSDLFDVACVSELDALDRCATVVTPPAPRCIGYAVSCYDLPWGAECDAQLGCVSGSSSCEGSSTSCGTFGAATSCDAQTGCAWDIPSGEPGACIGSSIDCGDISFEGCGSQLGCTYDSSCAGLSASCGAFRSSAGCGRQRGCQWEPPPSASGHCIGSSVSCYDLSFETCDQQLGCAYSSSGCSGLDTSCGAFHTTATCNAQAGCAWEPG